MTSIINQTSKIIPTLIVIHIHLKIHKNRVSFLNLITQGKLAELFAPKYIASAKIKIHLYIMIFLNWHVTQLKYEDLLIFYYTFTNHRLYLSSRFLGKLYLSRLSMVLDSWQLMLDHTNLNCSNRNEYFGHVRMHECVCSRHEVPVTADPIAIVHMDEDVVVVNKPASIPVSGIETPT